MLLRLLTTARTKNGRVPPQVPPQFSSFFSGNKIRPMFGFVVEGLSILQVKLVRESGMPDIPEDQVASATSLPTNPHKV